MARCFEESKRAYASGDRAGAKVLSNEGKGHKSRMEQLNAEASSWAYASKSYNLKFELTTIDDLWMV